jgi:cation diffusion facilitator CzcD-associated flavoprotein CzcO
MHRPSRTRICIIGAGPYGVSIAAHLRSIDMDFRIFGISMHRWRTQMPVGMYLKSEGCASSLSDPAGHTLARYCAEQDLPYGEWGKPVSREVFTRYALSFQRNLVPSLENSMVTAVRQSCGMFELELSSGERLNAEQLIIATGLEHMAYTPPELDRLPANLRSHSADHHDLSKFKGKDVAVIGGGQSALETAALLHEEGASVHLLVRKPSLRWNPNPDLAVRTLYQRLRRPRTNLGDGLKLWLYSNAPGLFRHLPQRIRLERSKTVLGPAGAWWLKDRVDGRLPILLGHSVHSCEARGGRAVLQLSDHDGRSRDLTTDHVIAATGYRFQLHRLPFLAHELKSRLRHQQQVPALSANFESSVPGLYFAGLASYYSFGPAMRFLDGASYTAGRIADHLAAARHPYRMRPAVRFADATRCREFSDLHAPLHAKSSEASG